MQCSEKKIGYWIEIGATHSIVLFMFGKFTYKTTETIKCGPSVMYQGT